MIRIARKQKYKIASSYKIYSLIRFPNPLHLIPIFHLFRLKNLADRQYNVTLQGNITCKREI